MQTNDASNKSQTRTFDTDSRNLKVDNCASKCISPYTCDFISELTPLPGKKVIGIKGTVGGIMTGTIKWDIEDDDGVVHEITIPNSLYISEVSSRLMSPQHWAQESRDNAPNKRGTWCATYADEIVLYWDQQRYKRTIKLDKRANNIATIKTAPGYSRFEAFRTQIEETEPQGEPENTHLISDDEDTEDENQEEQAENNGTIPNVIIPQPQPVQAFFDLYGSSGINPAARTSSDLQGKPSAFLEWHYRLAHLSPKKIIHMAKAGILPRSLSKCPIPLCSACMYGKATRRPWRSKPSLLPSKTTNITAPGQCVSIDQLESPTPGLIAQMKGIPTNMRYKVATIFVDHFSRLSYVHLQKTTSAEETLHAKQAFEAYARNHGVQAILHYHADNGRFADNAFRSAVHSCRQSLSFCGVNAHFQNGVAERRIGLLQQHARVMLIHAHGKWPSAINTNLWPYALRLSNDVMNCTPNGQTGSIPIERFAKTAAPTDLKQWFPFGCPAYVLNNDLQAGNKGDKWKIKSRIGVYLGKSPQHASTVSLILSLTTGLVSPQFHLRMDPLFETIQRNPPPSLWQQKCHFKKPEKDQGTQRLNGGELKGAVQTVTNHTETTRLLTSEGGAHKTTGPAVTSAPTMESQGVRTSTRTSKPPERLIEVMQCEEVGQEDSERTPMFALAASADPDTMYYHEAMQQPDKIQFIKAMKKEVDDQTANGNWKVVKRSEVPTNATILPAVWSMKRKRRIDTREVYKWKARLNIDGSKQVKNVNYWHTYAPVASWPTIRLILTMAVVKGWCTRQIDFVMAYTQAEAETDTLYMKVPKGFVVPETEKSEEHVLQIIKNIYGQKQAGRVWNKHLVTKLKEVGFSQSEVDECVFYCGKCIYVLYTDDSILTGPDPLEVDGLIAAMCKVGLNLTVEGDVSDFLGVKIDKKTDGSITFSQPHLIQQILKDLRLDKENVATKPTPASTVTLLRHQDSPPFDGHFDYSSIIGKLNYLERCSRPDLSYAVHQCARFSANPREEHGKAVQRIGRYLAGTNKEGITFRPTEQSFDCFVDADFTGNWDKNNANEDSDTARSRTGYIIAYAGCPITWASKLQTQIALSTTEAEYMALSTATREVIPMMELVKELKSKAFGYTATIPKVHCRVFEDNNGALEIATVHKFRPRTKHINTQYHHFRSYVDDGSISIHPIKTDNQWADILTKSLPWKLFQKLRKFITGW